MLSPLKFARDRISVSRSFLPTSFEAVNPANRLLNKDSVEGVKAMADSREVMNIRQASQYLGVSPDTLYKYVGEQKIPAFKLGNRWRFKKSKLDEWMEEKSTQMETKTSNKKKPKAAIKAAGQL